MQNLFLDSYDKYFLKSILVGLRALYSTIGITTLLLLIDSDPSIEPHQNLSLNSEYVFI